MKPKCKSYYNYYYNYNYYSFDDPTWCISRCQWGYLLWISKNDRPLLDRSTNIYLERIRIQIIIYIYRRWLLLPTESTNLDKYRMHWLYNLVLEGHPLHPISSIHLGSPLDNNNNKFVDSKIIFGINIYGKPSDIKTVRTVKLIHHDRNISTDRVAWLPNSRPNVVGKRRQPINNRNGVPIGAIRIIAMWEPIVLIVLLVKAQRFSDQEHRKGLDSQPKWGSGSARVLADPCPDMREKSRGFK